jgi:hypothetical protein
MTAEQLQDQAENVRLTADLNALREQRRTETAAHEKDIAGLQRQRDKMDLSDAARELVGPERDWASKSAAESAGKLMSRQLKLTGGVPTVTDDDGYPVVGHDGGFVTPAQLREKFRASHPEFLKQSSATSKQAVDPQTSDQNLRRLFGSKSEGWYAAKLAKDDIDTYRKLRTLAKERGIK